MKKTKEVCDNQAVRRCDILRNSFSNDFEYRGELLVRLNKIKKRSEGGDFIGHDTAEINEIENRLSKLK